MASAYNAERARAKGWRAVLVFGSIAAAATGCRERAEQRHAGTGAAESSTSDRPLEIVIPTTPATLDPRYATDAASVRITRLIHAGLVRLDPNTLAPEPYAAQSFRFIDRLTLEVTLRAGVRFHDGAELTARDVCATLAAVADPILLSPHRPIASAVGQCESPEPNRVVLRLAAPHATLLTDLEIPILRADQARDPPHPNGDLDGIGPYRVKDLDDGAVALAPAEGSVLPRPAHAVTVRTVHDENARALRLLAGRADIAPNAISPTLLPALESTEGLHVRARPGANVTYLLFACDHPPFDRAEIRRAVGQAIDRGLIARTLLAGHASVAATFFPAGSIAAPPELVPLAYDPAAARAGLAELSSKTVTLFTSTDRLRANIARAIAQELGDAGLTVEVVPLDFGVLLQRLASGSFEMATLQMPELTEPNLLRWFFHSSSIPSYEHPATGANRARYRSRDVDQWLDAAAADRDIDVRRGLYARVATRLAQDAPAIPLWHEDQVAVVSERARGFELSLEGRWLGVAELP